MISIDDIHVHAMMSTDLGRHAIPAILAVA